LERATGGVFSVWSICDSFLGDGGADGPALDGAVDEEALEDVEQKECDESEEAERDVVVDEKSDDVDPNEYVEEP
jgi:hypothetical protein